MNPFPYADDNKRYHTWNYFLRHKFGTKVFKVSLNGGFTCPNIDGTKGVGGCIYCSPQGSGDFGGDPSKSIPEQFEEVAGRLHKKWREGKYIAYFQARTNTYAPAEILRERFEAALALPNVVGLSVATRCDALEDDALCYLSELKERTYLMVELGLQTVSDKTGRLINRGHTFGEFVSGYEKLKKRGIDVCIHLINGLPGEDREQMMKNVRTVAALRPRSVKLHLLHVLKSTPLAAMYERGQFRTLELSEYVALIADQLEILPPEVVIQRLTGDGAREELIAPLWSLKKFVVLNEIDKELVRRGSFQGRRAE